MRKALLALAWVAGLGAARADVVHLKTGKTFEGKIVEENPQEVKLRTGGGGVLTFPRGEIKGVERGESPLDVYTQRAAGLGEGDAKGHLELAEYCLKNQLPSQGIAELRRVLAIQPDHKTAKARLLSLLDPRAAPFLARGKALQDEGQYEQAEKPLIAILEQYPECSQAAQAQHSLARGFAARKRFDEALTRWTRALKLDPALTEAYEGAAQAAIELADYPQALKLTEGALEQLKDSPRAAALRDRAAALRELAELAQAAKAEKGDKPDPARFAKEGALLARLGLGDRSLARLEAAYAAGARDPALLKTLADDAERTGRVRYALELCDELAKATSLSDELLRRRTRLQRLALVPKAFAARTRAERDKLLLDVAKSGAPFAAIETALREGAERPPAPTTGLVEDSFIVDEDLIRAACAFYVPKDYDPRRPWPLILAFHRDGDTGKDDFFNWETLANAGRYILMLPTAPRKNTEWRFGDIPLVLSALRHAARAYNIDTNRVYVGGTLSGGMLAWAAALRHPDRFAALAVRNAALDEVSRLYLPAAVNLPVYQAASELASPDILGPLREVDATLAKWSYVARKEEVPGSRQHASLPELNPKVAEWLEGKVRDPYTPRVRLVSFEFSNAEAFWVRIDRFADSIFDPDRKLNFKAPMGMEYSPEQIRGLYVAEMNRSLAQVTGAVVPGNRINLTTKHVAELTVSLSDKMVDLGLPVSIYVNGRLAFREQVERSLDYLLESARRHRDPRLCYSARVQLKLKDAPR